MKGLGDVLSFARLIFVLLVLTLSLQHMERLHKLYTRA